MLCLIAQFAPSLLGNDSIKKSTSLSWIWKRICNYSFSQSNFLKLFSILWIENEYYENFYQHFLYDGDQITEDEQMSPTVKCCAVFKWLTLIDNCLPQFISYVSADDLQLKSSIKTKLTTSLNRRHDKRRNQYSIFTHTKTFNFYPQ